MATKTEIIDIIFTCIEDVNLQNETNIPKDINAKIFGKESSLDSLGLVNLIVSIEEAINDKYDVTISIADEKAMSQVRSPFRAVDTLVDYIHLLLEEGKGDA